MRIQPTMSERIILTNALDFYRGMTMADIDAEDDEEKKSKMVYKDAILADLQGRIEKHTSLGGMSYEMNITAEARDALEKVLLDYEEHLVEEVHDFNHVIAFHPEMPASLELCKENRDGLMHGLRILCRLTMTVKELGEIG